LLAMALRRSGPRLAWPPFCGSFQKLAADAAPIKAAMLQIGLKHWIISC
jgi:hypothetical protein